MLGVAFLIAALPILRSRHRKQPSFARCIIPHPSDPSSMLSFAALPSFLILLTLARFGFLVWVPVDPLNSPDSSARWVGAPNDVDIDFVKDRGSDGYRLVYPRTTAAPIVEAAWRVESPDEDNRIRAIQDLAWWTAVCPNYGAFSLPRLERALEHPDPRVKAAAAVGLGSIGDHAKSALPALRAARGTTVAYFDHIVAEAVFLIEHSPYWAPETECDGMPAAELERRLVEWGNE
jgi:hypothetical protein